MKIALLTNDNRDAHREYEKEIPWFGTAPEALLQGFKELPAVEVHVVSCTQRPMKSPAKLAENIFFHSLHVPKIGWMRTGYQGCIRATRRKVREIRPDLVHGQGTERDCSISAVFSGYPSVLTILGNMAPLARQFKAFPGSFHWLAGQLENFTLPRAEGVLCNSVYTEAAVRARSRRTWLVPNSLRPAFFAPPPQHPPGPRPRLINVGVISPLKRQLELLALFKRLHEQGHAFQIEFVGRVNAHEPYGREFLQAIDQAGAHGYAIYSGVKEEEALIEAFDHADGSVHFSTAESFGLVVAEALSRNLKFFGARVGGIIDITASVEGAELFEVDDWTGLEQALARWMRAGWPRPRNAAQIMMKRYHPRVIAERHLEIYREVLGALSPHR